MRSIARCIRKCLIIGVTVAAFSLSLAPFNEIAVAQPSINIDVIENISLSDTPAAVPPASIDIIESITVTDSPEVHPSVSIYVSESITVTDTPSETVETVDTTVPSAVTDLNVASVTATTVTLTWTAPGDDDDAGTASQYDIRMSLSPIATNDDFDNATPLVPAPSPNPAGTSEAAIATSLSPGTTYYFALKTADEVPNWSGLSNIATATTWNTPLGVDVVVPLPGAIATFDTVTADGQTSVLRSQGNPCGGIPSGFQVREQFIDISTTAGLSGNITVGIRYYDEAGEHNLRLFHWTDHWEDVTTWVDTENNIIYGEVSSLSWFFIGGQWVWVEGEGVPAFPSLYIGLAAAFGAVIMAYTVRRKLVRQHN